MRLIPATENRRELRNITPLGHIPPTQDFTNPVHYIVKASNFATSGITTDYTVTASVAPASTACDILTFGLRNGQSGACGRIVLRRPGRRGLRHNNYRPRKADDGNQNIFGVQHGLSSPLVMVRRDTLQARHRFRLLACDDFHRTKKTRGHQ